MSPGGLTEDEFASGDVLRSPQSGGSESGSGSGSFDDAFVSSGSGSFFSPHVHAFSLTVLIVAVTLNLVELLIRAYMVPDIRSKVAALQSEITSLRAQALKLVSPDTFAAAAKADRKAVALEKELDRLQRGHAMRKGHWLVRLPGLVRSVLFVGLVFVVVMSEKGVSSRRVVLVLEPGWVWPLGRWLGVLSGVASGSGAIGMVAWGVLCHRVSTYVLSGGV